MSILVNAYATVRELPPLEFPHTPVAHRDRTDPDLPEHLEGFIGFVMQGDRPMTQSRYHVMRHIERVQNHVSVEVEEQDLAGLARWAIEANAVLFLPDGTVRDPACRILVDPETGDPEPDARIPFPPDAIARKQRHDVLLAERGLRVAATLPPVVGEVEVHLRSVADIVHRACALAVVAIRAEALHSGTTVASEELQESLPEGFAHLSPAERSFLDTAAPTQQEVAERAWGYEALWLLAWVLELVDKLPDPTSVCNVPAAAKAILESDRAVLIERGEPRSVSDILDALDFHLRLHWTVRETVRAGAPLPDLDPGVIRERHRALNWLVRFEGADWDDVQTPT